jgi:hypothetical protein
MIGYRGGDASGSLAAATDRQTVDLWLSLTPALSQLLSRIKLLVSSVVSHYQR